eukprot:s7646_g2.t1
MSRAAYPSLLCDLSVARQLPQPQPQPEEARRERLRGGAEGSPRPPEVSSCNRKRKRVAVRRSDVNGCKACLPFGACEREENQCDN